MAVNVRNVLSLKVTALVTLANQLSADMTSVLRRAGNRLLALFPLAAVIADLTAIRAEVIKLVTDLTATRAEVVKLVTDVTEVRGKLNSLVTAYNATLAKLDADGGVTDVNYAATNPGTAPNAVTAANPAAITAANPAALTTTTSIGIVNGTTAGYLKPAADVFFSIGGTFYRKAATDDLWNLSAQTDTTGAQYRAIALYLDASGTASIGAGSNAASAAAAIAALPATPSTKALVGTFVAGLSTDFDAGGGLSAQGTIYNGHPGEASIDALTNASITVVPA
jgi:hypothetical protein